MKKLFLFSFLFILFVALAPTAQSQRYSQHEIDNFFGDRGEIYFKCMIHNRQDIHILTRVISIDNVKGLELYAYANRKEFDAFLTYGFDYTILPHPGTLLSEAELNPFGYKGSLQPATTWNFYPTYDQYVAYMVGFTTTYPTLCKLDTVGTSMQGRLILSLKISRNPAIDEAEPEVLYTSSIHGDETTGYVLMLHLIDYLLSNYGTDAAVTNMVNTTAIFINPLANPDGTYHGGNGSVSGAVRYNANGVDVNRNFPDPKVGPHPDGNAWQVETQAWMAYAAANHFNMSANFHGGSEVFNYPWDTWAKLNADDDWWQFVGREWADTVHKYGPAGYFTDEINGITNGYAWYEVNGGRQDYMNYFHNCREVTVELSYDKLMLATLLPSYWNYNFHTFLNYITESHYGFNGIVTDTVTDQPLAAKVFIALHDKDFTEVYSSLPTGFYARPIAQGNYNVTFSAPGYFSKTITNVVSTKWATTNLNVQLRPLTYGMQDKVVTSLLVYPNPSDGKFKLILPEYPANPSSCSVQVINTLGSVVYTAQINPEPGNTVVNISIPDLQTGLYFLKFNSGYRIYLDKLIIKR